MSAEVAVRRLVSEAPRFVQPLRDVPGQDEADQPHALTRFVDLDCEPRPHKMLIPGFVQDGFSVFSGMQGVGKTSSFVPLALVVAGLHARGDELAPKHWRHVVYIAEDIAQVQNIVAGIVMHAGLGIDPAAVRERFHVVPALRMPAEEVAKVGPIFSERFTRSVSGIDLPPLVVIDTRSATIECSDENDNAEAGRIVALFKQRFAGLPLWMVGHLAKALVSRKDVQALSMRGAGAIEADANQTLFLVSEDDGRRFLVLGKRRFEPRWTELELVPGVADTTATDEWGDTVTLSLRWAVPTPPTQSRAQAREDHEEQDRIQRDSELRGALLDAVEQANHQGLPLSRSELFAKVQGAKTDAKRAAASSLLADRWIVEAPIPAGWRAINNSRRYWLIRLTAEERDTLKSTGKLPESKLIPPASIATQTDAEVA